MRAIQLIPKSPPPRLEGDFSNLMKEFVAACLNEVPDEVRECIYLDVEKFLL